MSMSKCNSLRICHDNSYHHRFLYSFRPFCTFRYSAIKMASYFMRNMFWSNIICFSPTDFHILSDRMSDTFFQLSGSLDYNYKQLKPVLMHVYHRSPSSWQEANCNLGISSRMLSNPLKPVNVC
jgi:hypothetical protein